MRSSSSTEAVSHPEEQILVGVVLGAHGVRGEVAVSLRSDNPDRFVKGAALTAIPRGESSELGTTLRVLRVLPHKGGLRVAFEGVEDRDAADRLRNLELFVPKSAVPAAEPGSYYHFELIGCRCFDEVEGDLGEVMEVLADGGGWLLEVERLDGDRRTRISLPFVEAFLVRVDSAGRRIDWKLPAGLVEACASAS